MANGQQVKFFYSKSGSTTGFDPSSGILFDGQNKVIKTHGVDFRGTDTDTKNTAGATVRDSGKTYLSGFATNASNASEQTYKSSKIYWDNDTLYGNLAGTADNANKLGGSDASNWHINIKPVEDFLLKFIGDKIGIDSEIIYDCSAYKITQIGKGTAENPEVSYIFSYYPCINYISSAINISLTRTYAIISNKDTSFKRNLYYFNSPEIIAGTGLEFTEEYSNKFILSSTVTGTNNANHYLKLGTKNIGSWYAEDGSDAYLSTKYFNVQSDNSIGVSYADTAGKLNNPIRIKFGDTADFAYTGDRETIVTVKAGDNVSFVSNYNVVTLSAKDTTYSTADSTNLGLVKSGASISASNSYSIADSSIDKTTGIIKYLKYTHPTAGSAASNIGTVSADASVTIGSSPVIIGLSYDANGHVVGVKKGIIKSNNTNTWRPITYNGGTSLLAGNNNSAIDFMAGTGMSLVWDSSNKRLTFNSTAQSTDNKVAINTTNVNADYPLLFKYNSSNVTETTQVRSGNAVTDLAFNPSTKKLTVGLWYCDQTGSYFTSDKRRKTDIKWLSESDYNKYWSSESLLRSFKWKDTSVNSFGVVAQEIEEFVPEAVSEDNKTGIKSVNYSIALSKIIAAQDRKLREQDNEIKSLKAELSEIKDILKTLVK